MLMGGDSPEREVSLASGSAVAEALGEAGHEALPLDITFSGSSPGRPIWDALSSDEVRGADLLFLCLHGGFGENGGLQALLEEMDLTYTGSGPSASMLAMDKWASKMLFSSAGIPVPEGILVGRGEDGRVLEEVGLPCVVKPRFQGSTVGLSVVREEGRVGEAVELARSYGDFLAERFVPGRDITVAVLGDEPLPVVEIKPEHEVYDYICKYTPGMSEYEVPAKLSEAEAEAIEGYALRAFRILGCRDFGRVDFRMDPEGRMYCLEVNTIPGMTSTSLVPKAAEAAGIGFPELVDRIAKMAMDRRREVK